jgi:hypothetical protein
MIFSSITSTVIPHIQLFVNPIAALRSSAVILVFAQNIQIALLTKPCVYLPICHRCSLVYSAFDIKSACESYIAPTMLFSVRVIYEDSNSWFGFPASKRALVKIKAVEMHRCSGVGRSGHKISDRFGDHRKCFLGICYTPTVDRRRIPVDPQLESSNHYYLLSI